MFAPLVLLVAAVLALWPRTRGTGLRALSAGAAGAAAMMAAFFVLHLVLGTDEVAGLLVFACALGFNAGVCWRVAMFLRERGRQPSPESPG